MPTDSTRSTDRLLVCYIPALDLRTMDEATTPYISRLLDTQPWARIHTLPTVDHVPTLLTGTYPHEHGLWGLKLRPPSASAPLDAVVDMLPELVTTTAQCVVHAVTGHFDLATMPASRRRRFESKRFKAVKLTAHRSILEPIGGLPTVFSVVGKDDADFVFHADLKRLGSLLERLGSGRVTLEVVEVHALDRLQHWRLDQPERIRYYYRQTDDFVRDLHQKCERNGVTFVLLSDHGMEPVTGYIDLLGGMRRLGVPSREYSYFIENTRATYWFHSDRARATIGDWLASQRDGSLFTYTDMRQYCMDFRDASYGDVYFFPNPGFTFYPNDFCHPLANRVLAYQDWQQRPRMTNARHRGDHGYRPEAECERGLLVVADDGRATRSQDITLVDFAPTILDLLGHAAPASMRGASFVAPAP
jgi:hypothetical protein